MGVIINVSGTMSLLAHDLWDSWRVKPLSGDLFCLALFVFLPSNSQLCFLHTPVMTQTVFPGVCNQKKGERASYPLC